MCEVHILSCWLFGVMTAGQFVDRFGVPDHDQWGGIKELVRFSGGRFRSIVPFVKVLRDALPG